MIDAALRPMSTSQVLDRTFSLYRQNFVLFAGIAMVGPALSLVASFIQLGALGVPVMPNPGQFDTGLFERLIAQSVVGVVLGLVFYTIGQALAVGATMHAVSMVHLGKTTTIAESYRAIKSFVGRILIILLNVYLRAFWPIMASYALLLLLAFSMVLLTRKASGSSAIMAVAALAGVLMSFAAIMGGIVWAVYTYCRYSLAVPACVLEKLSSRDSLRRSKFLAANSLWRIIAIYLLTFVMSAILTSVLQIPAYLTGNIFSIKSGPHITSAFLFWSTLGNFVGQTLAGPIATIAIALVYYDQRVRKEAFDLQLMLDALGPTAPPPVANSPIPGMG